MQQTCKFCNTTESSTWWKCCPEHTSEQGTDVVCVICVKNTHQLCVVRDCARMGVVVAPVRLGTVQMNGGIQMAKREYNVSLCEEHKHLYNNNFIGHLVGKKQKRVLIENEGD